MNGTWYALMLFVFFCHAGNAQQPTDATNVPTSDDSMRIVENRAKAMAGDAEAEFLVGQQYLSGNCVLQNFAEATKWYRKAAEQGNVYAQVNLGCLYQAGNGVPQDYGEALNWFRRAADKGSGVAQNDIGICYRDGKGVSQDYVEAVKWFRKAADQGSAEAQNNLASCYVNGTGVIKDYVEAYKWADLALAQGCSWTKEFMPNLEGMMTPAQIAEGQKLARAFKPGKAPEHSPILPNVASVSPVPMSSGTGFFITENGFLVTAAHVVTAATQIRILTSTGLIAARLVKLDVVNDLALLKAEGHFSALPVVSSQNVRLGTTVATIGFPNIGLQGFSPKLAKGEIASLAGSEDDSRYFQTSVPIQPGNSGGALVDERGNVIGVVVAKLNAGFALTTSGALPENVNYAVKSSFLLNFLESAPEVSAKLQEINSKERKFEDMVNSAQEASVLLLIY